MWQCVKSLHLLLDWKSFFIAFHLITTTTNTWTYYNWTKIPSPLPPTTTAGSAIAYDPINHTIWLLGGFRIEANELLVSFNYLQNKYTFTEHDTGFVGIYGIGQYYSQIGSILYFVNEDQSNIHSFNIQTMTFTPTAITASSINNPCVVSIRNKYIALLNADGIVQIVDTSSLQWLVSIPSLLTNRDRSACAYLNDKMFIIGGTDSDNKELSSIEYMDVSTALMMDTASMSWQYNADSLPQSLQESRSLNVNDDVLVIGGFNGWDAVDAIYVIDSITGSVSIGGRLAFAVALSAPIFVNNVIYSFGGYRDVTVPLNAWQIKTGIPTVAPTTHPTIIPSESPTFSQESTTTHPITIIPSESTHNAMTTFTQESTTTTFVPQKSESPDITTKPAWTTFNLEKNSIETPYVNYGLESTMNDVYANNDDSVNIWMIAALVLAGCVMLILSGGMVVWIKEKNKKESYSVSTKHMDSNQKEEHDDNDNALPQQTVTFNDIRLVEETKRRKSEGVHDQRSITRKYDDEGVRNEDDEGVRNEYDENVDVGIDSKGEKRESLIQETQTYGNIDADEFEVIGCEFETVGNLPQ